MSRLYGRIYDVHRVTEELLESEKYLPKYKKDTKLSSWQEIETTPEKVEMYLPDQAIDFLMSKKIKIYKNPLREYTLVSLPTEADEERKVVFNSLLPYNEFKRELMFYVGMILSDYNHDKEENLYEIPHEYDDLLPLLLEYLYMKKAGKEKDFILKHLNELVRLSKFFDVEYKDYQDFNDFKAKVQLCALNGKKLENFRNLCEEKDNDIIKATQNNIVQLSSLEALLGVLETINSEEDIKELIKDLMLNKNGSRNEVLMDRGIDSYGFKRLKKELQTRKKK